MQYFTSSVQGLSQRATLPGVLQAQSEVESKENRNGWQLQKSLQETFGQACTRKHQETNQPNDGWKLESFGVGGRVSLQ